MADVSATRHAHRGSIFAEDAIVKSVERYANEQYVLRLVAPRCAAAAKPGSFIHLKCDAAIPMRRPLSIMRADPENGYVDVLFKVVGIGLEALTRKTPGDVLNSLGPIGRGFVLSPERPRVLLIGGGVGIPPMIFLAETLRTQSAWQPFVFMGSELPFPFELTNARQACPGLDGDDWQSLALLETWGIPGRLASLAELPGTYRGYVTELAERTLEQLSTDELERTELFACGPTPMLKATADLARRYGVACQISLEEFMACAVGGCAGCTVLVHTDDGPAMQRVCVDGPVFDAARIFPAACTSDSKLPQT